MVYTEQQVQEANSTKDTIWSDDYDDLKSAYNAGAIMKWDETVKNIPMASVVQRNAKLMSPEYFESWYNIAIGRDNSDEIPDPDDGVIEYEFEMFAELEEGYNSWIPITRDSIKNPEKIDEYITKKLLRRC